MHLLDPIHARLGGFDHTAARLGAVIQLDRNQAGVFGQHVNQEDPGRHAFLWGPLFSGLHAANDGLLV